MVATISVLGGASVAAKYFTATSGYYDVERSGQWFGKAADENLNLRGKVDRRDLEMLLAGYAPWGDQLARKVADRNATTGSKSTTNKRPGRAERVPGYDLCFSAPKSVSILWAVGSQENRATIEQCMKQAVGKTLTDLEKTVPLARRGRNGTRQIDAKLVSAMFLHTTSRDHDPQLHIHSVIANLCHGADGRWSSVNSRLLHQWTPALGRVFRCHLASALVEKMNVQLERPQRDDEKLEAWFEVKGVSKPLIEEFSKRRAAIEKATPDGQLGDSHARARANTVTRKSKDRKLTAETLREEWSERAREHGFTDRSVQRLRRHRSKPKSLSPDQLRKVFDEAISEIGDEKAHFQKWHVVSEVCERLQHQGIDASKILPQLMDHLQQSQKTVHLDQSGAEQEYSSRENWDRERQLLDDVTELSQRSGATVSENTVRQILQRFSSDAHEKVPLSEEQQKAVSNLLTDQSSVRVMTGVAGAGKSNTLRAVRVAMEREGYEVIGGALAGKAAAGLNEKTEIQSRTVASYLYHLEKRLGKRMVDRVRFDARMMILALRGKKTYKFDPIKIPKNGVLIIDEAGMLDTRTLQRLMHHVKKAGATLILVGDTHQLPPIAAGGPLDRISQEVGRARLATNYRQQNRHDSRAVAAVRDGRVKEAIDSYDKRGRLTVSENQVESLEKIVEAWKRQGGTKRPEQHIILSQTRAEAKAANLRCQQERLTTKQVRGLGVRHGETTYYRGDRVLFHMPMRKYGIENGFSGTIQKVDPLRRRVFVELDSERSRGDVVTIPLSRIDDEAMSLGYAATTHKLQGATVDHALVMVGGKMLSNELAYTQLTRARKTTRLFASEDLAGKDLEQLVKAMSRSVRKDLAHDVVERSAIADPHQTNSQQQSSLRH